MNSPLEGKSAPWTALADRAYESKPGRSLPLISNSRNYSNIQTDLTTSRKAWVFRSRLCNTAFNVLQFPLQLTCMS